MDIEHAQIEEYLNVARLSYQKAGILVELPPVNIIRDESIAKIFPTLGGTLNTGLDEDFRMWRARLQLEWAGHSGPQEKLDKIAADKVAKSKQWYDMLLGPIIGHTPGTLNVFPRFFWQGYNDRLFVIAHELWHAIELQHGLIEGYGQIMEGTATYAGHWVMDREPKTIADDPFEDCNTIRDVLYSGCENVVANYLGSSNEGISALLNRSVRDAIQNDFLHKLDSKLKQRSCLL